VTSTPPKPLTTDAGNNTPVFFMRDLMKFQHFIAHRSAAPTTTSRTGDHHV
jgi:catalase